METVAERLGREIEEMLEEDASEKEMDKAFVLSATWRKANYHAILNRLETQKAPEAVTSEAQNTENAIPF